jgi:GPH family glycoside/pentoside/hexuronide:cation symporter
MLRNRAWVVAFLFTFFYFVRFGAMMAETAYLAIDVLGQPWMISVMLPAVSGMLLLSAFVAPPLLARTGIRKGCLAIMAVSAVLFLLLPLAEETPALFLAIYFAACLATSLTITAAFTMIAGTVDWHERLFGRRNEGILSAGVSLSTKLGMALGSAGVAFVLGWAGYQPGAVTETAQQAIRWSYYGGAALLLALQGLAVWFWPMDDHKGEVQ